MHLSFAFPQPIAILLCANRSFNQCTAPLIESMEMLLMLPFASQLFAFRPTHNITIGLLGFPHIFMTQQQLAAMMTTNKTAAISPTPNRVTYLLWFSSVGEWGRLS